MEIKAEHIIVLILIGLAIFVVMRQTAENFNVIEDRRAFPLTNEAGDLWIKEFDRLGYYIGPDGKFTYVKDIPDPIPKSLYKEQVYEGTFETPPFNYAGMPIPKHSDISLVSEDEEGDFERGPSCKRMNESDSQQVQLKYAQLQKQHKQMTERMTNVDGEMHKNVVYLRGGTDNLLSLLFIVLIGVLIWYLYSKK
jgi:hypothetical protein